MSLTNPNVDLVVPSTVLHRPGDRYAYAARQFLRAALEPLWANADDPARLAAANIELTPDERVLPTAGDLFIGIVPQEQIDSEGDLYETVSVSLQIHCTVRISATPMDREAKNRRVRSPESSTDPRGVVSWVEQMVNQTLTQNHELLDASNDRHSNEPRLLAPLVRGRYFPIRAVGNNHFLAQPNQTGGYDTGLLKTVEMTGGLWHLNTTPC